jgi:hypothetical protein
VAADHLTVEDAMVGDLACAVMMRGQTEALTP